MSNQEKLEDALDTLLLGYLYTGDKSLLTDVRAEQTLGHFPKDYIKKRLKQLDDKVNDHD